MPRHAATPQHYRINRAITAISLDPGAAWSLEALADVACLSKFHFCRTFGAYMGESPASFLWRTRLEQAALTFNFGLARSVTDTALDLGFASPEAFSRAFARRYSLAPRAFLRATQCNDRWVSARVQQESLRFRGRCETVATDVEEASLRIEALPAVRVAYLRRRGPYNTVNGVQDEIVGGFAKLYGWAESEGLLTKDSVMIGVSLNSSRLTFPGSCLYDICITIDDDVPENGPVGIRIIPGGRFAVLRVSCPVSAISEYWNWLSSVWLPASGETRDVAPSFERYPLGSEPAEPGYIDTEICLRLTPR